MTMQSIAEAMGRALDPAPPVCCKLATGQGNKGATMASRVLVSQQMVGKSRADGSFRGLPRADISNPSTGLGYVIDSRATFGFFGFLGLKGLARDGRA